MTTTPETDEQSKLFGIGENDSYISADFARTLEHQRDTARAEAKEAKDVVASLLQNSDSLRAEVERLTKELDESREHGAKVVQDLITRDRQLMHSREVVEIRCREIIVLHRELATLRATRDADHGAAIEAEKIRPIYDHLCLLKTIHPHFVQLEWLDTLKALITNSQQKGGESPCALLQPSSPNQPTSSSAAASIVSASNAASTSDPEGAANLTVAIAELSNAWEEPLQRTTQKLATPSPTPEKLAREIDGLYEAPSRIRPLRHILAREFGASQSASEAANEISNVLRAYTENDLREIESILSRFREHELRELREECERLRKDKERIVEAIRSAPCPPSKSNGDYKCRYSRDSIAASWWSCACPLHVLLGEDLSKKPDAAMQPREETKP